MHQTRARRRLRQRVALTALVLAWTALAGYAYFLSWRRRQTRFATAILNAVLADLTEHRPELDDPAPRSDGHADGHPAFRVAPWSPHQQGEPPDVLQ